jgi:hypothetical protein
MIATLYRYPHPHDTNKFLYVGQERGRKRRDAAHRSGREGFGRRFKEAFPGVYLPKPVSEILEFKSQVELNELETIWMFKFHTWHGYEGGMNLTIPGSTDYTEMGKLGSAVIRRTGHASRLGKKYGKTNGRKLVDWNRENKFDLLPQVIEARKRNAKTMGDEMVKSGKLLKIASMGGKVGGRKNAELGNLQRIRTPDSCSKGGITATHNRWHVRRGVVKNTCELCVDGDR